MDVSEDSNSSTSGVDVTNDKNSDISSHQHLVNTIDTIPGSRTRHAPDQRMFEPLPPSNLLKIYKGCSHCRTQKIKCNGQEPCSRCRAFGLQCHYIVLPNQSANRIAALQPGATTTEVVTIASSPISPTSTPSVVVSIQSIQTKSEKKQRIANAILARRRAKQDSIFDLSGEDSPPSSRTPSPSPTAPLFSASTLAHAQSLSGPPNSIFHAILEAVDKNIFVYSQLPAPDEPAPSSEVMRRLVRLYLRYVHPFHRIIDEHDPEFWTRMDQPMASEVATIVYAMCTLGGILATKAPTTGIVDDVVHDFHKRTLAVKNARPEDIATIQTLLILQEFYVVTNQMEIGIQAFQNMLEIAEKIKLKERVQRISTQDKLSPGDAIIRNIWRMIVWTETVANIISLKTATVEPLKDLTGPVLEYRSEEVPIARSPALDAAIFHLGNLFKVFQEISKLKLPISPRDLHPVVAVLDSLMTWQNNLPRTLRCAPNRGYSSGGISPLASYLDLYYKLGHIFLLNSLPSGVRSNVMGLGPRRESPLRILATCANGITATVSDLIKESELRNFCMIPGIRCLTEAATIQLANSKASDPAISTPAKLNFMKTLWCIKYFNFSVPADVLSSILVSYDDVGKNTSSNTTSSTLSTLQQDRPSEGNDTQDASQPRTPSTPTTATVAESPTLPVHSQSRRAISITSDNGSSTAYAREGSPKLVNEPEDTRDKPNSVTSTQEGTASSMLTMSLNPSSDSQHRPSMEASTGPPLKPKRVHDGERSRSPSESVFSPKVESPHPGPVHAMDPLYPQRELHPGRIGSEPFPRSRHEYGQSHETHYSVHTPGPGNVSADVDYPPHGHFSSSRYPEQQPWHSPHYMYENSHGTPLTDLRQTSRGGPGELTRHRPPSPRSSRYGAPYNALAVSQQLWEDSEDSRLLPAGEDRPPMQSYSYSGPHPSRHAPHMDLDQERFLHEYDHQDYTGLPRHQGDVMHSSRPHTMHVSTSHLRHPRHYEYSPSTPHSAASEADLHSGLVAGYSRPGYSHQRHDRRISDVVRNDSPGSKGYEPQYHPRLLSVQSGMASRSDSPSLHSPSAQRASLGTIMSSADIVPLSPPSPHSRRGSRTLAVARRSKSPSSLAEVNRRSEGTTEDPGTRVIGSHDPQSLRTAGMMTNAVGPSSTTLAGRKRRASISMYDINNERRGPGVGRVSSIPDGGETEDDVARTLSASYNMDPLHHNGRVREQRQIREDHGHQQIPPQPGAHPTESTEEYPGQSPALQYQRSTVTRHYYREHYPTSHPSHSTQLSSDHSNFVHPRTPSQHSYSHYSYQSHQPAMSYHHRHSRGQHQEPRTSPMPSYPPVPTFSSDIYLSSAHTEPHRYPDHQNHRRQSLHEHHHGHADHPLNAQQQQQQQQGQDRGLELDRGRTGPLLPSGQVRDVTAAGAGANDHDDEDPAAGMSDLLRDPIRRKYQ